MRESAYTKARRYLVEGRLLIVEVTDNYIHALCRGDSGTVYHLGLDREWHCDCPASSRSCSHLRALKLVCVANTGDVK